MRTIKIFNAYFNGVVNRFQLKFCSFLTIFCIGFFTASMAQTLPSASSCTSNDLQIVGATLSGGDICSSCVVGTPLTRTLTLSINNTTGSNRTAFAFWGTLEITDGTTGVTTSSPIHGCNDVAIPPNTSALPPNTITDLSFNNINYKCGDILKITNLYLAWTDASPNSVCPLDPSKINPKCGTVPSIQINAGVNATSAITNVLCFGTSTGAINLTAFGGGGTFTYSWTSSNGGVIPSNQIHNEDITGLNAGTYTVTITDQNNCTATKVYTITQPSSALALGECSKTDVSCAGGDGSVTAGAVTNAVGTISYSWKNSSNIEVGTTATVNALPAGTYILTVTDNCFSRTCSVTVGAPPAITVPEATVTKQPDCNTSTGTVTVSSPVSGNIYTLTQEGVVKYTAANGVFSSVATGSYIINVSNGICSATGSTVTVNAQPTAPAVPTLAVVQPTCSVASANITITSLTTDLMFSLDGGAYAAYPSGGYTVTAIGSHTVTAQNSDGCMSTAATVTVNAQPITCVPLYSYTQGYYHNNGMGCTPINGSLPAGELIQLSLDNMDGIVGNHSGTLYLGKAGASFTASYNDAAKLQAIMPGGGKSTKLGANYNLGSNIYPPLKNGSINNTLLSQTITLALNLSIPNNGLGTFKLEEGYLTTMTKSGASCTGEVATCENGGTMSSLKITGNTKLMKLLKGKTVNYLLTIASAALGGTLPAGVSYADISDAVDVINQSFDEGRYSLGYNPTYTSCGSTLRSAETTTTETIESQVVNESLTVSTNPNPFNDKVRFTINSTVSGNAVLNLYDILGVKLATIYQGYLSAGKQIINYNVPSKIRGTLIYTLTVGKMQTNGKIVRAK